MESGSEQASVHVSSLHTVRFDAMARFWIGAHQLGIGRACAATPTNWPSPKWDDVADGQIERRDIGVRFTQKMVAGSLFSVVTRLRAEWLPAISTHQQSHGPRHLCGSSPSKLSRRQGNSGVSAHSVCDRCHWALIRAPADHCAWKSVLLLGV